MTKLLKVFLVKQLIVFTAVHTGNIDGAIELDTHFKKYIMRVRIAILYILYKKDKNKLLTLFFAARSKYRS